MKKTIHDYVKEQEAAYALPIVVTGTDWEWSMKEHIRLSKLYKHSRFSAGDSDAERDDKPFKNIVRPILNLGYRTEGFDVKDIVLYIDDTETYFKSFLVKKYHERWAEDVEMDTIIDDTVESVVDYGGALLRDRNQKKPELVPLETIAFCDQTNMLRGPIGLKHSYSPDELYEMAALGWGDPKRGANITIEEAIVLSQPVQKPDSQQGKENKTPGKYIECYEVHGMMPESWYKANGKSDKYVLQMHILLYYQDEKGERKGMTLFAGRAPKGMFKVALRDKIHGRALGFGGVEELFDSQVWTNYSEIAKKALLDVATKAIIKTTDPTLKQKHPSGLKDMENLEIVDIEDGKDASIMDTQPRSVALFDRAVSEWNDHARVMGAANEAALSEQPPAGTPFKLQALLTAQSNGQHDYRRGKNASFFGGVYTDWVLEHITRDITQGKKFLEELSLDELQKIAEDLVVCQTNDVVKEKILNGEEIIPADIEQVKQGIRAQFMKGGSKRFLEIFKDEMKDAPIRVRVSIAGKQKDLDKITDKFVNIVRQIIAAPQILDDPRMAKLFNQIIEYSGLNPIDFSMPGPVKSPIQPAAQPVIPNSQQTVA